MVSAKRYNEKANLFSQANRVIVPSYFDPTYNGGRMMRDPDPDEDDNWLTASFQEGGTNYNEQVGLVNVNAQANLNVTIFENGGAAAGTAGLGTAAAATGWIPVVGQVVAVVAAVVGIYQMLDSAKKAELYQQQINAQRARGAILAQEIAIANLEGQLEMKVIETQLELKSAALASNKLYIIGAATVLGISGFILAYKVKTK